MSYVAAAVYITEVLVHHGHHCTEQSDCMYSTLLMIALRESALYPPIIARNLSEREYSTIKSNDAETKLRNRAKLTIHSVLSAQLLWDEDKNNTANVLVRRWMGQLGNLLRRITKRFVDPNVKWVVWLSTNRWSRVCCVFFCFKHRHRCDWWWSLNATQASSGFTI